MKVLALDISTKSTGWFVSKRSCGRIEADPGLSWKENLVSFRDQVQGLVQKYRPTVVVIEDIYLRMNVQTLKQLAMFQGVATEVSLREGVEVRTITATQARKLCCGKQEGEFKKKQVFQYFVGKYGWDHFVFDVHNDITDAAALLWGHREKEKLAEKKNRAPKK